MKKHVGLLIIASFISFNTYAWWSMTYRVHNASNMVIKFNSTDWFDFGTRVYPGQTREHTYIMPPKHMYLSIYHTDWAPFQVDSLVGCAQVGLPERDYISKRAMTYVGDKIKFTSGTIDVVVHEVVGSNYAHQRLACSVITSQF